MKNRIIHSWKNAKNDTLPNTPERSRHTSEHSRTLPTHSRTPPNAPDALPNTPERSRRTTEHFRAHTTRNRPLPRRLDPTVTTDRPTDLTYLKLRPYGYRRGRGLEGEALPRYRWERLSLSRTVDQDHDRLTDVRPRRTVNAPWTRGRTQRCIMYARRPSPRNEYYIPGFQKKQRCELRRPDDRLRP